MKLFKSLLVAPAALGLLAPISANASEVNLNGISNYSDVDSYYSNSEESFSNDKPQLISGGEGLVDTGDYGNAFSTTTSATFGADFVIGAVDNDDNTESTTFNYQYGMNLSTSFTGEDSLALTIETGNSQATATAAILNMNAMADGMTLDGISYTFPVGDSATVMVGDSTDVSALYSTACAYSAFTDRLGDCGSGTAAGLGGGGTTAISSATIAAAYDFGNGFTVAGGMSGSGGNNAGLFTKESMDVYGLQAAYNTDNWGTSFSYAKTDTTVSSETSFWGINAFYSPSNTELPTISVGLETEDPSATVSETGVFLGLTWAEVGPGSLSLGLSSVENYTDAQTEYYQYEAAYTYPLNDGMSITPGVFVKQTATDDETGVIVKTSFSF